MQWWACRRHADWAVDTRSRPEFIGKQIEVLNECAPPTRFFQPLSIPF